MKNILFFTDADCFAMRGGIDRVVGVVVNLLQQHGCKCFLTYFEKTPDEQTEPFAKRIKIDRNDCCNQISNFLQENHIDRIVVSTANKRHTQFILPLLKQLTTETPVYFWYHSTPFFELIPLNFQTAIYRILHQKDKIFNLKNLLLSIFSVRFLHNLGIFMLRKKYYFIYKNADKIILLSKHYQKFFEKNLNLKSNNKFFAIGNVLSFDTFVDEATIMERGKTVLIVSRLEETPKRISLALKIWQKAEKNCPDWQLVIVGTGEDEIYYKHLAKKLHLKNCVFVGRQNPFEYYKKASIFMMTSSYEGFPMTLGEAQQMGVVPIVFDSFDAVFDIITDNKNGIIIPEKNITQYAKKLVFLMENDKIRQKMAKNAVESCKQFSAENVVKLWLELFEQ